jgi:hypothetical protein
VETEEVFVGLATAEVEVTLGEGVVDLEEDGTILVEDTGVYANLLSWFPSSNPLLVPGVAVEVSDSMAVAEAAAFTTILRMGMVLQVDLEGSEAVVMALAVGGTAGTLSVRVLVGMMTENQNGHDIRLSVMMVGKGDCIFVPVLGGVSLFPCLHSV